MTRSKILALLLAAALRPCLWADEPPHLDLVRGLRAGGMPDLALEYLEKLRVKPSPELAVLLPLELAKTRLELAAAIPDLGRRVSLQNQARAELQEFLQKNPKHPLAADAGLETARISAQQGKAQLGRARSQEAKAAQQAEMLRARAQFEDAAKQLANATAQIDAQLADAAVGEPEKQVLLQAKKKAELEQGINLLDQAQTYTDQNELAKRGELLKQAIETLEKASKREPKDSLAWLAQAWLGRCHQENDDPKTARKVYADVIAESGEQRDAARRLARYFLMLAQARDVDAKNPFVSIQKTGEDWLRTYANDLSTSEGLGVRFELANAYAKQAAAAPKNSRQARDLYDRAQKLFAGLEQTENEYTARAHELKQIVILAVSQERSRGDISKLKDFEECYLRAQLEVARLSEAMKKLAGDKLEEQRKQHFKNMLAALSRGIDLADGSVAPDDLIYARYLLTYAYLETGDYYAAAVSGEDLARTETRSNRAPMAGAYALRSYALLIAKEEEAGLPKDDLDADRGRLRRLAQYIEQTWPNDSAADIARHVIGLVALAEKNYPEAVEALERISSAYPEATRAFYQLASAAVKAQKDEAKPPAGKPAYQERAVAALERIPEVTAAAEAGTIQDYFGGKLLLADIYYRTRQYDKMQALSDALLKKLDSLGDKTKVEQGTNVLALALYAKLGRAEADYAAGQYTKTRELLDPVVSQFKNPAEAAHLAPLKEKDPRLLRALLGLALRASVEDNKMERGKEILDLLQKSFPDNSVEILVQFVQQLQDRVQQFRRQGESAKAQLDQTIANFSTFLDELAKQQESNTKPEILLFLARSYSSLDNHARAAELADRVAEPNKDAGNRPMQLYQAARLLQARELRLSKDFQKAEQALQVIQGTPWGQRSLEAKKERIFLLQDQDRFAGKAGAIQAWNSMMQQMKPRIQDNKVREQYFDCYYYFTSCLYKNALQMTDARASARNIRVAANYIVKLEAKQDAAAEPCLRKFQELLEKEPRLKEQYDLLKKNSPKG